MERLTKEETEKMLQLAREMRSICRGKYCGDCPLYLHYYCSVAIVADEDEN